MNDMEEQEMARGTESSHHETLITNPGIAERLEKDVGGFYQYGFSFERCSDPPEHHVILRAPISLSSHRNASAGDGVDRDNDNDEAPPAHLSIVIPSPSLVSSVGPFLRTLTRIADGVDPRTVRVNVSFDWSEADTAAAAGKIAHHIHMIVRNSMGAALFLTALSILLPDSVSVEQIRKAMEQNKDANYPSIDLIDREFGENDAYTSFDNTQSKAGEGRPAPPVSIQEFLQYKNNTISAKVLVDTRMCTVRLTPVLYHLARALRGEANVLHRLGDDAIQESLRTSSQLPLILACVDKVANLFRIVMLVRDYRAQHRLVLVVRNESIRGRLAAETNQFISGLDPSDACGSDAPRVETIDDTVRLLRTECDGKIVAVDLHDDALTLDDDNENTNEQVSALSILRSTKAVIWGFEKDGIPPPIDRLAARYIQVRCRSSLNLVAAMSVVMHRAWSDGV